MTRGLLLASDDDEAAFGSERRAAQVAVAPRVGEGRLLLEQRTFDAATGVAQTTQTLIEGDGTRESRTFSLRCYSATELLAMLERAGLADARCYGDLSGAPLDSDTRLVIVARND